MNVDNKCTLVPRLRFPEFKTAGEWASPALKEISIPVDERVDDRKLIPVSISAGIGFVPQAEKFGRDISGSQYRLYTVVRDGDFVYNKGNSVKFPQGCVYDLQGWGKVAAPNVFICFRLKDGYENRFFRQCFEKNVHGLQLRKYITSGARSNGLLNISRETFFSVQIPTPKVEEQQRIADCLSSLDDLIIAETRRLDALRTYRKGLMERLFPRDGETIPRLRFPRFRNDGEWRKRKISSLLTKAARAVDVEVGREYQEIGIRSHGKGIFHKEPVSGKSLGDKRVFWVEHGSFIVNIVFAWEQAIAVTSAAENGMIASHRFPMYKAKTGKADVNYIKYYFLTKKGKESLEIASPGGAGRNKTLGQKEFEKLEILSPDSVDEQNQIAKILSSIDEMIGKQARKLDVLRTHKKGLAQQLFPVIDEVSA